MLELLNVVFTFSTDIINKGPQLKCSSDIVLKIYPTEKGLDLIFGKYHSFCIHTLQVVHTMIKNRPVITIHLFHC